MTHEPTSNASVSTEIPRASHARQVFLGLLALGLAAVALALLVRPRSFPLVSKGPAPKIVAEGWLNGDAPTDESLAGKVVVVEVWATWCGPCRKLLPHMVEVHHEFSKRGVEFIGLTSERAEQREAIQELLQSVGVTWRNGWGAEQTIRELKTEYLPSVYVIGPDGHIWWTDEDGGELTEALELLLKKFKSHS